MSRFLALDIGSQLVGYAVFEGDPARCSQKGAFSRPQNRAQREILELLEEQEISTLVIGIPLGSDGGYSAQAEDAVQFCRRLSRRCSAELYLVDESFSTQVVSEREELSSASERQKWKRSGALDAEAAVVIGERYLAWKERRDESDKLLYRVIRFLEEEPL
ncbi:Holliday junction resolvase RuvX [bacterium]|nr:Holliday junction resolvase RuvX [bacterium]